MNVDAIPGFRVFINSWKNVAHFGGRISRKEFWIFFFFSLFLNIFFAIVDNTIGVDLFYPTFRVANLLPLLTMLVRRLHDSDQPANRLFFALIPYAGLVIIFIFLLLSGTDGPNSYGDKPKEI